MALTFSPGWLDSPSYKTWLSNFKLAAGNAFVTAFQSLKGGGPSPSERVRRHRTPSWRSSPA